MANSPRYSKSKGTHDVHEGGGNTFMAIQDAKNVEIHIGKSYTHFFPAPDPKGPTSEPKEETISCCKKVTGGVKHCDELKQNLQQFYRKLTLPKVAWIEKGKDLSLVDHFIQLELEEAKKGRIALEDIFQPINDRRPTRILIEGPPGFGKTTLAMKLAHDWATGKIYVKFKFVFLVLLRDLRGRSVEGAILEIGKWCNFDNNMEIFEFHMKDTLLILDGFDEISQKARTEIIKILYKQLYSDVTVILFCRTDSFEVTHEERRQLLGTPPNMQGIFHDKKITSLGVKSKWKKLNFLEKFLPKSRVDNLVKCWLPVLSVSTSDSDSGLYSESDSGSDYGSSESKQWELFNSPLLLMLLPIIMEQDEAVKGIATRTQFYKQLFNCILKHSYRKREQHIASDFDLFCLDSSPNAIQQSMERFGIESIPNIIEYNLQFKSSELTDEIHKLGFLIKRRELTFMSSRNNYEGLHQSFLEFAAAFGLWMNLKFKTAASVENDFKLIVIHHLDSGGTSLVLRFLVSLMESELDLLLSQIESFSVWFRLDFDMTVDLFSECQSNHFSKSKCLRNFIPHSIDLQDKRQCKRKLLELLEYGSECGQIKTIAIYETTDSEIFTIKIAPCCQIEKVLPFDGNVFRVFGSLHHLKSIPCDISKNKLLHFAASTNSEIDCRISWPYGIREFFKLIMEEKVLSQIKFRHLRIKIRSKLEENVVIQLLQNDQVAHLHLSSPTDIQSDMSAICCAAAKSIQLTHISLEGFTVDLYDLTAAGTKTYTFISFCDCSLTCRHPLLFKHCCNDSEIRHIRHVEEFPFHARQILITRGCDDKMFSDFIAKCPKSANVIPAISIDFFDYYTNTDKYFQTLIIDSFHANVDNKKLAIWIHKLPIINLVVYADHRMQTLFEHMNNLWAANNNSRLKTIFLDDLSPFTAKCAVMDLIEGLKCNHWQNVCIHGCDVTNSGICTILSPVRAANKYVIYAQIIN